GVGHVVDRLGERRHFTLGVNCELALQVAVGHRGHDLDDTAHLFGEVGGHDIDVVGQILPGAGDPGYLGLTAELALVAHLTRYAGHFAGEGTQLLDHRVEGFFELEDFAAHVDGDFARQVATGDGGGHLGDVAHLAG